LKIKKKAAMLISFAVGTTMFATTAMAEIASKSGYEQLKDALKYTAENCTEKLTSYTMDLSFVLKDNGNAITSETTLNKYNIVNNSRENISTSIQGTNKTENYYYADKNGSISRNSNQDTYYVNEYTTPRDDRSFNNPFKEKQAGDIERIADALIGNLKDYVVVSQNPDGTKELSGSLSEAQIPALVNAVTSYQFKNSFGGYRATRIGDPQSSIPRITKDIYVKEVKGKALVNKDGLIQSILGTGVLAGKDEQGIEHSLTFELLGKISDINSTIVNKPDLSGKKVEKSIQKDYDKLSNPQMYIGIYKNNIIIEKNGKLEKIGERILDITQIDDKGIVGRYYEEYKKGYEDYAASVKDFKFDAKFENAPHHAIFNYTNSSGKSIQSSMGINPYSANIYFNIPEPSRGNLINDGEFRRVFD
jgi:rubrerythrin